MSEEVFYITTPIYYVNDVPHLGHAYTTVAADFIARFRRAQGRRVHFLTGTDEHGQRIAQVAAENGITPLEWCDRVAPNFEAMLGVIDASNDDFIRTTEPRHESAVATFVQSLYDRDEIYLGTYEGLYCVGCEAFKQPDDLVDGKCPDHGTEPEVLQEENYFFRLSKYAQPLIDLYETESRRVMPEARRNEILGKLRQGLDDLSISRATVEWGIPVPWDNKHVIYVWVDALQNYITAVGYGADAKRFDRIWPASVHLVGKDILWFHSVIWPAMLMANGLPLPETVYAHGFLQVGGAKMSKSRLTGIAPGELTATFGSDGYRYYFMRDISFGQDGEFSWEGMLARYNSDLANDFGNLASRVLSMLGRYLDGVVPAPPTESEITEPESELMTTFHSSLKAMTDAMDNLALREALEEAWLFVRKANAYVESVAPWNLAKRPDDRRRLEVVLYVLTDSLRLAALMLQPIIPKAAAELWSRLGLDRKIAEASFSEDGGWGALSEGAKTIVGDPLFPRLEDEAAKS